MVDLARRISHDRLVNLHLVGPGDLRVMGFEAAGVDVVIVSLDRAIGMERPGLEEDFTEAIPHRDVEPDAPGGVGRGKLVPRQILDRNFGFQAAVVNLPGA